MAYSRVSALSDFMIIDVIERNIYRLRVPFENFTTSLYIYISSQGVAIIDSATYASDVDNSECDNLKGHREKLSLDGECWGYEKKK